MAGVAAADVTGAGVREIVDGAAGAASAPGAENRARTGTLASRSGLGDSLGGVGTGFCGIDAVGRGAGG